MRKIKYQDKSQTNPKSLPVPARPAGGRQAGQILNSKHLVIWSLVIICNLVPGIWNLSYLFAQDKIVAVVNNDVITQKDLDDFSHFMRLQLSREYKGAELEKQVQSMQVDLLDRLIEDRLILQEAKKTLEEARTKKDLATIARLDIDQNKVKARLNGIRKRYASDAEFQSDLEKQGLVLADIESRIKEQLLMYAIVEQKVRDKIVIRPQEVTSFYNQNIKEFVSSEEREFEVMILENENLANAFSYNLKSGQKLADLAARYPITIDTLRAQKGGELRKEIEDEVFKLGVGEIAGPIKIDNKYYVFKLNNIIPPRQRTLSEVQERVQAFLFQKKMQEELSKWLDELKKQSYVRIIQN